MYNYSFELTYRHQGGEAGSQYQADILGVFGMETFDEKAINDEVEALYSKVKPYMKPLDLRTIGLTMKVLRLLSNAMVLL